MSKQPITLQDDWRQWTEALESGRYRQGRGRLGSAKIGYCCLGVRCIIHGLKFDRLASAPDLGLFTDANPSIWDDNAIGLNDDDRLSFVGIAKRIRKHAADQGWS